VVDHELSPAQRRVWASLPAGSREALAALSGADLQTLLLSVAADRAARVTPAAVLRRWRTDRLVRPCATDPRVLAGVESRLWSVLPAEFDAVELSPVAPLGTCTAVAPVSQHRIVTATRSVEVVADCTNALAVEAADRRSRQPTTGQVHLAASHRLLRAQRFPAGWSSHFRLFALVSSARDTGSGRTQARLLALHLDYWQRVLTALLPETEFAFRTAFFHPAVRERFGDQPGLSIVDLPDAARFQGYYAEAHWRTMARGADGAFVELGDGGLTTWTAQLLGNAKERCLVSCLSVERLAALHSAQTAGPADVAGPPGPDGRHS